MKKYLIFSLSIFYVCLATAQVPYMVRNIETGGLGSAFDYTFDTLFTIGNTIYFGAEHNERLGLWKSNGDSASTELVREFSQIDKPTKLNGRYYFAAYGGINMGELELWGTDGTTAGTYLVKDIAAGNSYPQNLQLLNNKLLFTAEDPVNNRELWISDGTYGGTSLLKEIGPGNTSSQIGQIRNHNGLVYFWANDGGGNRRLWRTDGTTQGTIKLTQDTAYPYYFNNAIYMAAKDDVHGQELWKTDGTVGGTQLIKDIYPGDTSSKIHSMTMFNNIVYFVADSGDIKGELWRTDGTNTGTYMVRNINPNWSAFKRYTGFGYDNLLFKIVWVKNNEFYFLANSGVGTQVSLGLYKSNGTDTGTTIVKTVLTGVGAPEPHSFTEYNGKLYFVTSSLAKGNELWVSDGTTVGTHIVRDINPSGDAFDDDEGSFRIVWAKDDVFYFVAYNDSTGTELWRTDGTEAGTWLVKDIYSGTNGAYPNAFVPFNDKLLFCATDYEHGMELWVTDGTPSGTVMVKDIYPNSRSGFSRYSSETSSYSSGTFPLTKACQSNGYLYFVASNGVIGSNNNFELWKTDGTTANTTMLIDIEPGVKGSLPRGFVQIDDAVYFSAYTEELGREMWVVKGVDIPSGIQQPNAIDLVLYPNPAKTALYVKSSEAVQSIEIYGVAGGIVNAFMQPENGSMDISKLAAGMYVVHCKTANGSVVIRKFIKVD